MLELDYNKLMVLNIFERGASLKYIDEDLSMRLWSFIQEHSDMCVCGRGNIKFLEFYNATASRYIGVLGTDIDLLDDIYDQLDEERYMSGLQFKYYPPGHTIDLHRDSNYYKKVVMITLGSNKTYEFRDTTTGDIQYIDVRPGGVVILEGDAISRVEHGFLELVDTCGSVIIRDFDKEYKRPEVTIPDCYKIDLQSLRT